MSQKHMRYRGEDGDVKDYFGQVEGAELALARRADEEQVHLKNAEGERVRRFPR